MGQTVIDKYGFEAHFLDGDRYHPFKDFAEGGRWWDEPSAQIVFYAMFREYVELFSRAGVEALLCGVGAESVVTDIHLCPCTWPTACAGCNCDPSGASCTSGRLSGECR